MTIANCRMCGKTVTTESMVCPHCGASNPTPSTIFLTPRQTSKWSVWAIALVCAVVFFADFFR